jgi:hypothetical protein
MIARIVAGVGSERSRAEQGFRRSVTHEVRAARDVLQAGSTRHGPLTEKGRSLTHPVKGQPSVPSGSANERAPTGMSASLLRRSSSATVLTSFAFSPAFGLALADNVLGARASLRGRRLAAS